MFGHWESSCATLSLGMSGGSGGSVWGLATMDHLEVFVITRAKLRKVRVSSRPWHHFPFKLPPHGLRSTNHFL